VPGDTVGITPNRKEATMWLVTKYGFYSIVRAHGPDGPYGAPHPELMMIRARKQAHLVKLKTFHKGLGDIRETDHTDYPYRIIADRDVVALVVSQLMADVDYMNFKNAAHKEQPEDKQYHNFLHSVWSLGLRLTCPSRKP